MNLLLLLALLGFQPTVAEASVISQTTVEFSTSTAPFIINALAHRAGVIEHTQTLQKIAYCESRYEPNALSPTNDTGPFQINRYYHTQAAKTLGYDIEDPFDNVEYAMLLFKKEGTRPWNASKHCWGGGSV